MSRARAVGILLAAAGLVLVWTAVAAGRYELVVTSEDGTTLWTLPASENSAVILQYTNSLYNAQTQEHFTIRRGRFSLTEVRSTSDAVLASNSLPTPYLRQDEFFVSTVQASVSKIVTRIGPVGRQVLLVGDQKVPLFEAGIGERVVIWLRSARSFPKQKLK